MSNQEQTPGPSEGATSSTAGGGGEPSEEEIRAALEAEYERLTVNDVLLQTLVSLLNLGGRKLGTSPGTEHERDLVQVHAAIEGVRALFPVMERTGAASEEELGPALNVLSQLQMAFVKLSNEAKEGDEAAAAPRAEPAGEPAPETPAEDEPAPSPGQPGPARASGRLWVPGDG